MNDLRTAAQQALEALEYENSWHEIFKIRPYASTVDAITALRAALAQQAEPVKHQHKWFRTGAMEPGQMRCIDCGEWGKEQAEPLNLADPAVQKRLASQWGYVPAAAQAEPVQEPVAWLAPRTVDSYSRPDLGYETCSKSDYGAFPAYTAPPQRKLVPLTEEEILAAVGWERAAMYMKLTPNFPVDEAKKETLTNARAVEKASWEKNHGQA